MPDIPEAQAEHSLLPAISVRKRTRSQVEGDSWLASETDWRDRVGKGWVAKKVLGKGGYGIVGL